MAEPARSGDGTNGLREPVSRVGGASVTGDVAPLTVTLAWVDADDVRFASLHVAADCDVAGVLAAARQEGLPAGGVPADWSVAIFGRAVPSTERVRDGDRIELLGPLRVDPKVARMRRVAHKRAAAPGGKWNRDG